MRRGLAILPSASLTEYFGHQFTEATELLEKRQLTFLWRASHSNNDLVESIVLGNVSNLWRNLELDTRQQTTNLSYKDFKSRIDLVFVFVCIPSLCSV